MPAAQAPASKTPAPSDPLENFIPVPSLPLPTPAGCSLPPVSVSHLDCKVLQEGPLHIDQVKPEFKAQHAAGHHRSQQVPWAAVLPSGVIANKRLTSEGGRFSASRLHRGFCTSLTTYNISNMPTLSLVATPKGPEPVTLLQQECNHSHRQVLFASKT